jgi:hypothetical protein
MFTRSSFLAILLAMAATLPAQSQAKQPAQLPPPPAASSPAQPKPFFLFNGRDLSGWQVYNGNADVWRVEDEKLVATGGGGGWLMTRKQYRNFVTTLQYRLQGRGNSGVALRAPLEGDPAFQGMEIQILDDEGYPGQTRTQYTGAIWDVFGPSLRVNRPVGDWNQMSIGVLDNKVQVTLNGTKIVDVDLASFKDQAEKHPGLLRTSGYIGLQSHTGRVEFRNITMFEIEGHGNAGNANVERESAAQSVFKDAAKAGGMSAADIDAVLAARGSVSYEALTDFAKDQIKEGRKGKDLKDDLLTFIKILNEKK